MTGRPAYLRISLAKHEVKGGRGIRADAPGYARIDFATNTFCWMIEYKDGSGEIISRRSIVEELENPCITPGRAA